MFILLIKVRGGAEFMCQPLDLGLHKGRKCRNGEKHWKSEKYQKMSENVGRVSGTNKRSENVGRCRKSVGNK